MPPPPPMDPSLYPAADEIYVEHAQVLIIGAGPVGLFLALKLAKEGIDVLVLESEQQILQSPRATTYVPTPAQLDSHSLPVK